MAAASLMFDPAVARLAELMTSGQIITKTQAQWVEFCKLNDWFSHEIMWDIKPQKQKPPSIKVMRLFFYPYNANILFNVGRWDWCFFFISVCSELLIWPGCRCKHGPVVSSQNPSVTRVTAVLFIVPLTELKHAKLDCSIYLLREQTGLLLFLTSLLL